MSGAAGRLVRVPAERMAGWFHRYDTGHPGTEWTFGADAFTAASADGATVVAEVPFPPLTGPRTRAGLLAHLAEPRRLAVVLVRRGGFAVANVHGTTVVDAKVGRRHVQGRTKAGGWSQQRFARRRDNQAKAAFDAAADHAQRLLVDQGGGVFDLLATGGDRGAVTAVLAHPPLALLAACPTRWLGGVPDPTRSVLDAAIVQALSVELRLTDPEERSERPGGEGVAVADQP